jgi:anti-sigma factor RsiW
MRCRRVQKKLSAYQDGELDPREQERVASHMLICRACRVQYEKLERIRQTLAELEEISPDPGFYSQISRRIEQSRQEGWFWALQRGFKISPSAAIASAVLVAVIVLGAYLGDFLVRCDFLPLGRSVASSEGAFFNSLRAFDLSPPGTLADGYLHLASHRESDLR